MTFPCSSHLKEGKAKQKKKKICTFCVFLHIERIDAPSPSSFLPLLLPSLPFPHLLPVCLTASHLRHRVTSTAGLDYVSLLQPHIYALVFVVCEFFFPTNHPLPAANHLAHLSRYLPSSLSQIPLTDDVEEEREPDGGGGALK